MAGLDHLRLVGDGLEGAGGDLDPLDGLVRDGEAAILREEDGRGHHSGELAG